MKNFKLLTLLASVFLLGFYACDDEANITNVSAVKSNRLQEITSNFTSSYAQFKDGNELLELAKIYSELGDQERQDYQKNLPFQNLQSYLTELHKPFDGFQTRDEFVNYLKDSDYLQLITQKEDGVEKVVPVSPSYHFAVNFINKDKILKVGNTFQKYLGVYMVEADNYNALLLINEGNLDRSGLKYSVVVESVENINLRNELDVTYYQEAIDDNSFCKNDRRIEWTIGFYSNNFTDINNVTVKHFTRKAFIEPYKKGIPCVWYRYSTPTYWNNCNLSGTLLVNGSPNVFTFTVADATVNTDHFERSHFVFAGSPANTYNYTWSSKRSSLSHQGMGGIWLESY
ncbi:MAG: hypothetical protein KDC49_22230 [Saprospiraceae bacterium]|nr:hypothetical protein [Saprospiraceae bacterium]